SHEEIKQIAERLNYLETVARDTVSRLYAIEARLRLSYTRVEGGEAAHTPRQQTPPPESVPQQPKERQAPEPERRPVASPPRSADVPSRPASPDSRPPVTA